MGVKGQVVGSALGKAAGGAVAGAPGAAVGSMAGGMIGDKVGDVIGDAISQATNAGKEKQLNNGIDREKIKKKLRAHLRANYGDIKNIDRTAVENDLKALAVKEGAVQDTDTIVAEVLDNYDYTPDDEDNNRSPQSEDMLGDLIGKVANGLGSEGQGGLSDSVVSALTSIKF